MNQSQRNFLIEKIQKAHKIRRDALDKDEQPPSLGLYLLHAVMSGNFEIIEKEKIKEIIRQKALKANDREDWLGNNWMTASKDKVWFALRDFFIIPEEFEKKWNDYREKERQRNSKIAQLDIEVDTLITRIKLASNKTLQSMINEIDDMGDISLMETKLKQLTTDEKI